MIATRFDLVNKASNKDCDRTGFVRVWLHQVPDVGESINLNGNPFVVVSRGWAVSDDRGMPERGASGGSYAEAPQHAYVKVVKHGEFEI